MQVGDNDRFVGGLRMTAHGYLFGLPKIDHHFNLLIMYLLLYC
jgi:hypothetical protein